MDCSWVLMDAVTWLSLVMSHLLHTVCTVYAVNACIFWDLPLSLSHSLPVTLSTALHNLQCHYRSICKFVSVVDTPTPTHVHGLWTIKLASGTIGSATSTIKGVPCTYGQRMVQSSDNAGGGMVTCMPFCSTKWSLSTMMSSVQDALMLYGRPQTLGKNSPGFFTETALSQDVKGNGNWSYVQQCSELKRATSMKKYIRIWTILCGSNLADNEWTTCTYAK